MLKVIFQDDHLLVFDKPPGLIVTKSETSKEVTLEDILKDEYKIKVERGGIVHRLDKDTSGLIVVAKTAAVLQNLQDQFKERDVAKEYLCLVHGHLDKGGKIDAPIGRNPENREKFVVFKDTVNVNARTAVTGYEPLELRFMREEKMREIFAEFNKIQMRKLSAMHYTLFTLLRCKPLTGRTHQIRVHLKYIGFPIVGDSKYGGRKVARLDHRWCKRQFLHAAKLELFHPQTGERMMFESKLPEDLQKALNYL